WNDRYNLINAINLSPVHPSILYINAATFEIEPLGKPSAENTWKNMLRRLSALRRYPIRALLSR
ncbi:MAG: hypothetical protein ACXU7D_11845, partial [Burkholderiaceae bacterium]